MAGAASEDDAVSLNVTPLIDIIFCLCIFFMCSFHFKQLEGKLDSWLPKNGCGPPTNEQPVLDEVRVQFTRDAASGGTRLQLGSNVVGVLPASVAANPERERILAALE